MDAAILNELIDKIVVHHKEQAEDGRTFQQIEIYYRFVGKLGTENEYPRRHNRANTAVTHEKSKYDMTSLYRQPMVVGSSPTTSSILVIPNGYSPEKARIYGLF